MVTVQGVICISSPTYSAGDQAQRHAREFVDVMGGMVAYWTYRGRTIHRIH